MLFPVTIQPKINSRISEKVIDTLYRFNNRCFNCGSTMGLHIHHRIFISEGDMFLKMLIENKKEEYRKDFGESLKPWGLHDIQNLVILCQSCHEGMGVGVHGGNSKLNNFLKETFTCPLTGLNMPFSKSQALSCMTI